MNLEIKEKWVAAIRSGKYKQGKRRLKKINHLTGDLEYCCLGILCEIHAEETGIDFHLSNGNFMYYNHGTFLPEIVIDWAGLPKENHNIDIEGLSPDTLVVVERDGRQTNLAYLNDNVLDFEGIAGIIEEQL